MRRYGLLKCWGLCLVLLACVSTAGAQDLKSIISGVAKAVVGDKATTASSIIGTWKYVAPDCQFESESLFTKAGGEAAAKEVENKLQGIYNKVGVQNCQYTFHEDGTYSHTFGKRTTSGTYTFDNKAKTVTMKDKLGIKSEAHVAVTGSTMSLVFKADKLMGVLKTVTGTASKVNTTASAFNTMLNKFDGMQLGFELKKK